MYLVLIAWLYVTILMAVAEATAPGGSLLGAGITFILYGLLPAGIIGYILGTPARKRALRARRQAEQAAWEEQQGNAPSAPDPDAGSHAPTPAQGGGIAPVREET